MVEAEDIVMTQKTDLSMAAVDTVITAGEDATVIPKDKEETLKASICNEFIHRIEYDTCSISCCINNLYLFGRKKQYDFIILLYI